MSEKNYIRDTEHAAIVVKVARITGYKKDTINAVIKDERKNEIILSTYMEIKEVNDETENRLIQAVKDLIPFK